jgi:DNA-binding NarL/FixJ family response regulator
MRGLAAVADPCRVRLTCLIVDDNALFLDGAADLLRRQGIDVVGVASKSEDAARLVRELRPDVALVDVDLGEEDGFELTEQLSGVPDGPKVVLVSTHAEEDLAHLIASSSALGFVAKAHLSAEAILDLLEPA